MYDKNSNLNKISRKSGKDNRRFKKIFYLSSIIIVIIAICVGVAFLIDANNVMYVYKDNRFYVQNTEKFEKYAKNKNVTFYKVKNVPMTRDGINDMIDDYRKPLYDTIGEEGTKKFKKIDYLKVTDVKDDGKTLTVMVEIDDKFKLAKADFNIFFTSIYNSEDLLYNDYEKFIMNMAYVFKENRNLLIKFKEGHFRKNEYNEDVYVKTISYGVFFKKSDLSRVSDWKTYSYRQLKKLNAYK